MSFNEGDWLAYRQANLLFAEVVRQHVHPGDIVWVQGAWVLEWSWRTRLTRGMQTITSALFRSTCVTFSVGLRARWESQHRAT